MDINFAQLALFGIASHELIDWQGFAAWSGSSLAALITSVAALIASIAAYRKANKNGKGS